METKRDIRLKNLSVLSARGISIWPDGTRLQEIAKSLHRLSEASCNYGLTPRQETRETRLEEEAQHIANQNAYKVYIQTDPRGWPLYLYRDEDILNGKDIDTCYSSYGIAVCPL